MHAVLVALLGVIGGCTSNDARPVPPRETVLTPDQRYLEENRDRAGVQTTPSGLQHRVLRAGTGPMPTVADTVTVHYRGTLIDGREFDSSYRRDKPATIALLNVIPGWREGIQLMRVGGRYELVIPSRLAYGSRGQGAAIPPYATLVFEVELLDVAARTVTGR